MTTDEILALMRGPPGGPGCASPLMELRTQLEMEHFAQAS